MVAAAAAKKGDKPVDDPAGKEPEEAAAEETSEADESEPEKPDDETPETKPEGETKEGEGETDDPSAIRRYFKEKMGPDAHAWIDSFTDDDALIKGIENQTALIGRRHADSQVVKYLQDNGITAQELETLIANKGKPAGNNGNEEWNPKWVTINAKGQVSPTASAPPDIEARIARRQALVAEAMFDDEKMAALVAPHIGKDIDSKAKAAQQELQAQMAQQEEQRSFAGWVNEPKHRNLLYIEGTNDLTPLGKLMESRLQSGKISRELPLVEQAEDAFDWAVAKSQKQPDKKPVVNPKGKHQATPAGGTARRMTAEDFFKKYGNGLAQWVEYNATGALPTA